MYTNPASFPSMSNPELPATSHLPLHGGLQNSKKRQFKDCLQIEDCSDLQSSSNKFWKSTSGEAVPYQSRVKRESSIEFGDLKMACDFEQTESAFDFDLGQPAYRTSPTL